MITDAEIRATLASFVTAHGSQMAASKALGVSQTHVCNVVGHQRPIGTKILQGLGFRKVVMYEAAEAVDAVARSV